jgi:hypothetical protein
MLRLCPTLSRWCVAIVPCVGVVDLLEVWICNRLECVGNPVTRGVSGLYRSSLLLLLQQYCSVARAYATVNLTNILRD